MQYDFQKERYQLDIQALRSEVRLTEANIANLHYQLAELDFKIRANEYELFLYLNENNVEKAEDTEPVEIEEKEEKPRKLKKENG